jgi:hypothetical protein
MPQLYAALLLLRTLLRRIVDASSIATPHHKQLIYINFSLYRLVILPSHTQLISSHPSLPPKSRFSVPKHAKQLP